MTVRISIIVIRTRLIIAAVICAADRLFVFVNNILKYVLPYVQLWHNTSTQPIIESSPRIFISVLVAFHVFFIAPAYITSTKNAVPKEPLANIPTT